MSAPDVFRTRSDAYAAGELLTDDEFLDTEMASLRPVRDDQVETAIDTAVALEGENARLVEALRLLAGDVCVCQPSVDRRGGPACPRHTPARLARELLDELGIAHDSESS